MADNLAVQIETAFAESFVRPSPPVGFHQTKEVAVQPQGHRPSRFHAAGGSVDVQRNNCPGVRKSTADVATAPATNQVETLSAAQQQTLLTEAGDLYEQASSLEETDTAEANTLFTKSASKYQLLVDSGISNPELFFNLGNAYLKSNQLGQSIAAYEQAKQFAPRNAQYTANLDFANSLVKGDTQPAAETTEQSALTSSLSNLNQTAQATLGRSTIMIALATASVLFWSLLTLGIFRPTWPTKRLALAPLALLLLTGASIGFAQPETTETTNGIVVANQITLHSGDGE